MMSPVAAVSERVIGSGRRVTQGPRSTVAQSRAMTPTRGWFYPAMAVVCLLIVLAGFAPTYYLRAADAPPLPAITQVHGLVFTAWMLLFLAQVTLVATGRRVVHTRLGVIGAVLAAVMIVLGLVVSLDSARRAVAAGNGDEALAFLIVPLGSMLSFGVLIGWAVAYRTRIDIHRRLMLMATIAILPAAIGRIPQMGDPLPFTVIFLGLLMAPVVADRLAGRPLSRLSLWGGLVLYVYELGRFMSQQSSWWMAIARWLVPA